MTRSSAECNDSTVTALVREHIPEAILLSSAGGELAFQLPLSNKGAFAPLFQELEERKEELHIGGYGVSMTTLEEVFLRLASDSDTGDLKPAAPIVSEPLAVNHETQNGHSKHDVVIPVARRSFVGRGSESSFLRAYGQMLLKRILIARRDWKASTVIFTLHVAIMLVGLSYSLNRYVCYVELYDRGLVRMQLQSFDISSSQ